MTGAGDGEGEDRAWLARALAGVERSVAAELGEGATEQVREYVEHHEFGLALELLVCIVMRAGLAPTGYEERVAAAARRMDLPDSEPLAEWRRYRGRE